MTCIRVILMASLIASAPLTEAVAQVRGPLVGSLRQDQAREDAREGRVVEAGEVLRRVESGRDGRRLSIDLRGDVYIVRWEYPGGRVVDIVVDARTGRILGER